MKIAVRHTLPLLIAVALMFAWIAPTQAFATGAAEGTAPTAVMGASQLGLSRSTTALTTIDLSLITEEDDRLDPQGNLWLHDNGEYRLTGSFDRSVIVGAEEVTIHLDNVEITSVTGEGIRLEDGSCAVLILEGNNKISANDVGNNSNNGYAGIRVSAGSELTIKGTGKLVSTGSQASAGIGSGSNSAQGEALGDIIIESGTVVGKGGYYGAGIGGGLKGFGGSITINGGTVTGDGTRTNSTACGGAGIGGGHNHPDISITINDGTVRAEGAWGAAAIGSGAAKNAVSSADINITNGTVTAYGGGSYVAAIGSGAAATDSYYEYLGINSANINISGGTINAYSSRSGSSVGTGIGAGGVLFKATNSADIVISGGNIQAHGGLNGAGIGGTDETSVTILIEDGDIEASGYLQAVGIGVFRPLEPVSICIEGGTITATGDRTASLNSWNNGKGTGIGTREADMSTITIGGDAKIAAYGNKTYGINGIISTTRPLLNAYFADDAGGFALPYSGDLPIQYSNGDENGALLLPESHHSFAFTGEAGTYQFRSDAETDDGKLGSLAWFDTAQQQITDFSLTTNPAPLRVAFIGGDDGGGTGPGDGGDTGPGDGGGTGPGDGGGTDPGDGGGTGPGDGGGTDPGDGGGTDPGDGGGTDPGDGGGTDPGDGGGTDPGDGGGTGGNGNGGNNGDNGKKPSGSGNGGTNLRDPHPGGISNLITIPEEGIPLQETPSGVAEAVDLDAPPETGRSSALLPISIVCLAAGCVAVLFRPKHGKS